MRPNIYLPRNPQLLRGEVLRSTISQYETMCGELGRVQSGTAASLIEQIQQAIQAIKQELASRN